MWHLSFHSTVARLHCKLLCPYTLGTLLYFTLLDESIVQEMPGAEPVMHHCLICACYLWLWLGLCGMSVTQWVTLSFTETIVY